ncbi:formate transporter FocA [Pseudovibrio exalbescens]|uniref:Formate transporter FocA n=1 Tax=Pseudovibrio exalbescens TaxID=197461 RepID=A0A1U7JJ74_9HYPH|nr:formate transporter FocA [Pseudovibrio exalbescens]OKL44744.1 formate transporter FocA [Pseudovibrio exalbescens]
MASELKVVELTQFSPLEMMQQAEQYASSKTSKPTAMTLGLAVMAGVFIGLAFVFYITITTGSDAVGWGLSRVAGGFAFSMGLILVVICGAELFTSSVLSAIAWANRQISTAKMVKGWMKVYVGNFFGAMLLLLLVALAGLHQLDHGQWGLNALMIAQHKLHHTPIQAFALGILCNMLVCLAIWMTFSSTQMLTKAMMVILPVAMFVSTGFEHSVANMFMVPLGIVIQNFATPEFWEAVGATPGQFSDLTVYNFIVANLIPVTLGNIVGGAVLVGLSNWRIYQFAKPKYPETQIMRLFDKQAAPTGEIKMLKDNLLIETIMQNEPITLAPDLAVRNALDLLLDANLNGAPVVDKDKQLLGFFSVQDVLVELWVNDYMPEADRQVQHLMRREVETVEADDSVLQLAEYLAVDKETLYPTTGMGYATAMTSLPLADRAKKAIVSRPHQYPVMKGDTVVGVVTRMDVVKALRPVYGEKINVLEDAHEPKNKAIAG